MKGFANPEIGFGMGGEPGSANTSAFEIPIAPLPRLPIDPPKGWTLHSGFKNIPGVKASIPLWERRWLQNLRKDDTITDISATRINAIAEALDDDTAIDDIMSMLDVSLASEPQAYIYWNLKPFEVIPINEAVQNRAIRWVRLLFNLLIHVCS